MRSEVLAVLRLAKAGRREPALVQLRAYLRANPDDVDGWIVMGGLVRNPQVARSALRRALRLDPAHPVAQRAWAALEAGETSLPLPEVPSETGAAPAPAPFTPSDAQPSFAEVRAARALIWPLRPKGAPARPLGDLLAEGQVARQDLLWATREAEAPEVREAARVILATAHRLPDVSMAPQDARLVAWPFHRQRRPLGELVDAGTVSEADLRHAAWHAADARLREAARVLLPFAGAGATADMRPEAAAGVKSGGAPVEARGPARADARAGARTGSRSAARPMPVIQGADHRFEPGLGRYRWQWIGAGVALVLLLAGMSLLLYGILTGRVARHVAPWGGWLLMLALLLLLSRLATFLTELWQEDRSTYSRQQGAIRVARELRQALGGDWATFRNVHLPHGEGLADMVVLGPPGVFVVEVRAYVGRYRYRGRRFERRGLLGWRRRVHNPGRRARLLSRALQRHLDAVVSGEVPLMPRLVWVGPGVLELDAPEVPVWFLERVAPEVARLREQPARLTPPERAALFEVLREMCSALSP